MRLDRDEDATTFHVHGGGLVISRMVNELGIAKKVAATIEEAFATLPQLTSLNWPLRRRARPIVPTRPRAHRKDRNARSSS